MVADQKNTRFEELRLLPGQALQLEIEGYTNDRDRSVLVGYRSGYGLIVTTPMSNGTPMSLKLGTPLNVRLFATQMNCACAFHSEIVHISRAPYPHLHLAQPTRLELGEVRSSVRANVKLIASVHFGQDLLQQTSAIISDLSLGGARLSGRNLPVMAEEKISVSAQLMISGVERVVTLNGIVRSVHTEGQNTRVGVQFLDISDTDKISLQAYVLSHIYYQF